MPQPRSTVSYRPQTSRQAKRAYQKAGATPRISAAEQRRIDRAVELEDRAARIRLHNVRARENKRKKAEKDEKDREIRKRMGIQEPSKFKIGPSQLSLGAFVAVGPKHKKPEPVEDEMAGCSSPYTPTENTKTMLPSTTLMPPPPPRLSSKTQVSKPIPTSCSAPSKPVATAAATESDWDMFLDSNTQVEREISCHPADPPMPAVDKRHTSATTIQYSVTPPADLLAGISTQDLQYCSSPLTSKSDSEKDAEFFGGIEDEDLSDVNIATFFDCCDEIRIMITHTPPSSQHKQSTAAPHNERWPTLKGVECSSVGAIAKSRNTGGFVRMDEFDDYEFSSQELRQLVV